MEKTMKPKPQINPKREKKPRETPLIIDMPFEEFLSRIVRVSPPRREEKQ
jgi:hypothetical protein